MNKTNEQLMGEMVAHMLATLTEHAQGVRWAIVLHEQSVPMQSVQIRLVLEGPKGHIVEWERVESVTEYRFARPGIWQEAHKRAIMHGMRVLKRTLAEKEGL